MRRRWKLHFWKTDRRRRLVDSTRLRSLEELGKALDISPTTDGTPPGILSTQARTREKFGKGPFSTNAAGREILKRAIPTLADNIRSTLADNIRSALAVGSEDASPRGLEQILRLLTPEQLAFMALRTLLNQVLYARGLGPDRDAKRRKKKRKNPPKNPAMIFRLELGRLLRDELEFEGLFAAKKWVLAKGHPSKKKGITPEQAAQAKHIALGKFRRPIGRTRNALRRAIG